MPIQADFEGAPRKVRKMPPVGIRIAECHRDFVVAVKPAGVHSAPLKAEDGECALAAVVELFPEVLGVVGKKAVEGGLVHRIDFDTAGLLLFARSQSFYSHIMDCQAAGLFQKTYHARCQWLPRCPALLGGFPPPPDFRPDLPFASRLDCAVESGFRPYGPGRRQVRPVSSSPGRFTQRRDGNCALYATRLQIDPSPEVVRVQAAITRGYRHQVRCHLAWCGLPVLGDPLYNPLCREGQGPFPPQMQFFATGLRFPLADSSGDFFVSINPEDCSSALSA